MSKSNSLIYLFPFIFASAILANVAPKMPLEITSHKMVCERDKGFCVAEGEAKAVYGDTSESAPIQTLMADKFTVKFQKKSAPKEVSSEESLLGDQQVEEIHADGHVSFKRDDLTIHADRAEYKENNSIVHFYGHVRIKHGERAYSESEHATYDRAKNTYIIHDKAKIILYTDEK